MRPSTAASRRWLWPAAALACLLAGQARALEAQLRAQLQPADQAWVGQQLILRIDLLSDGLSFAGQRFRIPDLPGALLLEDAATTVKLSERVAGETWQVLSYHFPVFPQRPGRLRIPPITVEFRVSAGYGSQSQAFSLRSNALDIAVRSPPGVADPRGLVTTPDFELQVTVIPDATDLQVGDAVTRRIERRAEGVSAMAFRPLTVADVPGVAVYAGTPELRDRKDRGRLQGTRIETTTYVLQKAGTVSLPGLDLQWWDPQAQRMHTETIPGLSIRVAPNPTLAPRATGAHALLDRLKAHPGLSLAAALAMAACTWGLYRSLPALGRRLRRFREARRDSERHRFRLLLRACAGNRPLAAYNAYLAWLDSTRPGDAAVQEHQTLSRELLTLQQALIGRRPDWRGAGLSRTLRNLRRQQGRERIFRAGHRRALPTLNPRS